MATIIDTCERCGHQVQVGVHQGWQYGLRWSMSFHCRHCGSAYEADGRGTAPDNIRAAILREGGTWDLIVPDSAAPKTCIVKALREALNLDLSQAASLLRKIPGVVNSGTEAEMRWLSQLVSAECGDGVVAIRRDSSSA